MSIGDACEIDTSYTCHSIMGGPIADRDFWWPATVTETHETAPTYCAAGHVLLTLAFGQAPGNLFDVTPDDKWLRPAGILTEEMQRVIGMYSEPEPEDDDPCCY